MSSGEISCGDALDRLWELLDREMDDVDADRIREHIERCKHCYPQYDFDRAYRELLSLQGREQAPPELRHRVFMRLLGSGRGEEGG